MSEGENCEMQNNGRICLLCSSLPFPLPVGRNKRQSSEEKRCSADPLRVRPEKRVRILGVCE